MGCLGDTTLHPDYCHGTLTMALTPTPRPPTLPADFGSEVEGTLFFITLTSLPVFVVYFSVWCATEKNSRVIIGFPLSHSNYETKI